MDSTAPGAHEATDIASSARFARKKEAQGFTGKAAGGEVYRHKRADEDAASELLRAAPE